MVNTRRASKPPAAAAAGGVTSIVCLPDAETPIDSISVLEFIARRARETNIVKIYAYGTITRERGGGELSEFGILNEAGALAFTDGDRALADALVMRRALSYAATFGFLIIQHPEISPAGAQRADERGRDGYAARAGGHPAAAEVMMIERDLRLVEPTGARYHAAHVSTAAIDAVRSAKARGLFVTCDGPSLLHAERGHGDGLPNLHEGFPAAARRDRPACRDRGGARRHDRRDRL